MMNVKVVGGVVLGLALAGAIPLVFVTIGGNGDTAEFNSDEVKRATPGTETERYSSVRVSPPQKNPDAGEGAKAPTQESRSEKASPDLAKEMQQVLSSENFGGSIDADMNRGIGGMIGTKGRQIGHGGLGTRSGGLGGGGIAEGLGGLGTKGIGSGSSGYGSGGGHFGSKGSAGVSVQMGGASVGGRAAQLLPAPPRVTSGEFRDHGVNVVTLVTDDSQSTFAADVDTASYTVSRNMLNKGHLPPAAAVRVEEFVNYFPYTGSAPGRNEVFSVQAEAAPSPWTPHRTVLRIGVNTATPDPRSRPPMALTFLVDTSGSMSMLNKLPLAKRSLTKLVNNLGPEDTVAIATYAGSSRIVLSPTSANNKEVIVSALQRLGTRGGTAMGAGLDLAYQLADTGMRKGAENRVIIVSDGDANVGATTHDALLAQIQDYAGRGITLTTIGFGQGNYRDTLMEQLANNGDGNSYYIDSEREASRLFGTRMLATLQTVARDVKFQVDFNPDAVHAYRLVGYENRDIADKDFRNDAVDAGEVGPGHSVTALYELVLKAKPKGNLAEVRVRYKPPGADVAAKEATYPLRQSIRKAEWAEASADYRLSLGAATFAEVLRESPHVNEIRLSDVESMVAGAVRQGVEEDQELLDLIAHADRIKSAVEGLSSGDSSLPTIEGELTRAQVDQEMHRHLKSIRYCYQRELTKTPVLFGQIVPSFRIGPDGAVESASIDRSTMNSAAVESCVVSRIERMTFQRSHSGGSTVVRYPLGFSQ